MCSASATVNKIGSDLNIILIVLLLSFKLPFGQSATEMRFPSAI